MRCGCGGGNSLKIPGMIEWGQISKPPKIPWASNKTPKIPCRISEPLNFPVKALNDITRKMEPLVLNTPNNPYINQATKKNTYQNFPAPKKSRNRKFQTPKNPSDHPFTSNPLPPPHFWVKIHPYCSHFLMNITF